MPKTTTIEVKTRVKRQLEQLRVHPRESYSEVIDRILKERREGQKDSKRDSSKGSL